MATHAPSPPRVLLVYRALRWERNEGGEVRELLRGTATAGAAAGVDVVVTNTRALFRVDDAYGALGLLRTGGLLRVLLGRYDAAHVHFALHPAHLVLAAWLRLRGVPVVLSPMGMLGDDFATASWFRTRPSSQLRILLRRASVVLLRRLWCSIAQELVCVSREEARQARLAAERTVLAPLAAPATTTLAGAVPALAIRRAPDGPVAVVSRFDVHRKGLDRTVRWASAYRALLPTPAVLLFVPRGDASPPPGLEDLVDAGVVAWDAETRGEALGAALAACRGVMLLSRYEGMPRALREAALLGLPTVSTPAANFAEVVAALGTGVVVDGDDVAAVHAGFEALAGMAGAPAAARALLHRDRIGAFLVDVLCAVARREPASRDYYAAFAADHAA